MNGRALDISLFIIWGAIFFAVAMAHPGIANFLIAVIGAIAMGTYNTFIRHEPKTDALRGPWQPKNSHRPDGNDATATS